MAGGVEVTSFQKMSSVASNLEEIIGRYTQTVNELYEIGEQVDASFQGEASKTFKAQFGGDRERFQAMATMLQKYAEVLRSNVSTYQKADNAAIEAIRNA